MPLGVAHRQALLDRGFTDREIASRGYGTLRISGRAAACREILGCDDDALRGVPGFWLAEEGRGAFWTICGAPGLLLPCLAPDGRIRGLRVRPDVQGDGGKYRWLSSAHRPSGTGSGTHCHVARPCNSLRDDAVWITEGELKADLAAERLGTVVVSIPGVDLWSRALPDLAELLPRDGRVVVALDADWREKTPVHFSVWSLLLAAGALGYKVEVALWSLAFKGLDDLLVRGLRPELRPPEAVPAPPWRGKSSARALADAPLRAATPLRLGIVRARLEEELAAGGPCHSCA
jgi:hypothetical protein